MQKYYFYYTLAIRKITDLNCNPGSTQLQTHRQRNFNSIHSLNETGKIRRKSSSTTFSEGSYYLSPQYQFTIAPNLLLPPPQPLPLQQFMTPLQLLLIVHCCRCYHPSPAHALGTIAPSTPTREISLNVTLISVTLGNWISK